MPQKLFSRFKKKIAYGGIFLLPVRVFVCGYISLLFEHIVVENVRAATAIVKCRVVRGIVMFTI